MKTHSGEEILYSTPLTLRITRLVLGIFVLACFIMGGHNMTVENHPTGYLVMVIGAALSLLLVRATLVPLQIVVSERSLQINTAFRRQQIPWREVSSITLNEPGFSLYGSAIFSLILTTPSTEKTILRESYSTCKNLMDTIQAWKSKASEVF